ncbi:MAG: ABC transporter substrate-binding protein [Schwartzia sp. (in: firmicutes)]
MERKRIWGVLLLGLWLLVAAGCGEKPAPAASEAGKAFAVLRDDLGREVSLAKKPERIVVTSASFLEPLHAVGGNVVGRPDAKLSLPAFAKDKPSVGRVYQIDLEKVLACTPDLVIVNKGMNEKLVQPLTTNGISVLVMDMKNYEDVKNEVEVFAQVTGEKAKGEALIKSMEDKLNEVKAKMPKESRRVVILHSTTQGLSVQLDTSIAGSVAKMLGFTNVASGMTAMEQNPDAAPYSIETLVEQNPEILFITSMGKMEDIKASMEETIAGNPAWQTIPAIKNGKVYYLSQEHFLLSPGLHYPEAAEEMARAVYPEVFR